MSANDTWIQITELFEGNWNYLMALLRLLFEWKAKWDISGWWGTVFQFCVSIFEVSYSPKLAKNIKK